NLSMARERWAAGNDLYRMVLEGYRSGPPPELAPQQRQQLADILDSGPVAYGLDGGIWTSPMIACHRGGVRRSVSSWPCTQIAACVRIFCAAAPPRAGAGGCRSAGPLAPPHVSHP